MPRAHLVVLATAACFVLAPTTSTAHSNSHGPYQDDKQGFGWALISGGNSSMSDMQDLDSIEDLKSRFGDDFLYIREGRDHFVIRDRKLVERAREAASQIQRHGKEIGKLARAEAALALSGSRVTRREAKLEALQSKLESRIERAERRGDPTEELERELDAVNRELDSVESDDARERLTGTERSKLSAQRDEAREGLERAVREIERDMREILRVAKQKHLAEPLD
jgi:hypothetical protein